MVVASGLDLIKSWDVLSSADITLFVTGFVTAFVVAMLAIVSFLKLLSRVKLTPFAYYRFILGGYSISSLCKNKLSVIPYRIDT